MAFVLFLRGFVLTAPSTPFASLFERGVGDGGRCGTVSIIISEVQAVILEHFSLVHDRDIVSGSLLLVKIRQNSRHDEKGRVVSHQGLFQVLPGLGRARDLRLNLSVPFRRVDNCAVGHGDKALCSKVIHFVFETAPPASYK